MTAKRVFAIHPGEILREEFMKPLGLTSYRLAKELHLPIPRIHEIVRERRAVTADTAIRLARYFGTSAQVWMNLQAEYDIRHAEKKASDIAEIKPRASGEVA
jgi:addiction module HigA family antidote